jgi:hypothetical protein
MTDSMFNKDVDKWFDFIVDSKINNKKEIISILNKTANINNFDKLFKLIETNKQFKKVNIFIINIMSNKYSKEFRYKYSNNKNTVSVTSEFFSLLKQALTYKDLLIDIENHNRNINF